MRESKLGLNWKYVDEARSSAKNIAEKVQGFVDVYSTVSVERTICRFFEIDGVNDEDIPLPNVLIDHLKENNSLSSGAAFYISNAMIETGMKPQEIAEKISSGDLNITKLPINDFNKIKENINPLVKSMVKRIKENKEMSCHWFYSH